MERVGASGATKRVVANVAEVVVMTLQGLNCWPIILFCRKIPGRNGTVSSATCVSDVNKN